MKERPILFSGPMVRAILAGTKTQTRRVVAPSNSFFGSAGPLFWKHADFARVHVDGRGSGAEYLHVRGHDAADCEECGTYDWQTTSHRLHSRVAPARCWEQEPDPSEGYVPPASRLWVRETWQGWNEPNSDKGCVVVYRASCKNDEFDFVEGNTVERRTVRRWRPSIFLPRWASRLTLEITDVRVQRLQEITEEDAIAEGVGDGFILNAGWPDYQHIDADGRCSLTQDTAAMSYATLWDSINAKRAPWSSNPWVWALTFRRVA